MEEPLKFRVWAFTRFIMEQCRNKLISVRIIGYNEYIVSPKWEGKCSLGLEPDLILFKAAKKSPAQVFHHKRNKEGLGILLNHFFVNKPSDI